MAKKKSKRTKRRKRSKKKRSKLFKFGGLFKSRKKPKKKSKEETKEKPRPKPVPKQKPKQMPKVEMPKFKIKINLPKGKRKELEKKLLPEILPKTGKLLKEKIPIKAKAKAEPDEIPKEAIKQLIVADVMSKDPVNVHDNDRLSYVVRLFSNKKISGAPVLSDNRIVGVITKSDIIKIIGVKDLFDIDSTGLKKLEEFKASDIMRKNVPIVRRYTKIADATQIMSKHDINILPVVDDKRRVIGVVSRGDIVRVISRELLAEVIKERRKAVKKMARIETDIDSVLDIVEKEGSIGILEIKERLMVSEEKIEEWAKILEKEGLIELYYPAFGTPILRKKIKDKTKLYPEES